MASESPLIYNPTGLGAQDASLLDFHRRLPGALTHVKPLGLDPGNSFPIEHHWSLSCCRLTAIWMTSFACLAPCSAPGDGEGSSVPTFYSHGSICTPLLHPVFDGHWVSGSFRLRPAHSSPCSRVHPVLCSQSGCTGRRRFRGCTRAPEPHDHFCWPLWGLASLRTWSCDDNGGGG